MFDIYALESNLRGLNRNLERFMPFLTPSGVVLGLILGGSISWMKPSVSWLFAFLTLINSMSVGVNDFYSTIKHPKPVFIFALCGYIVMPLLVCLYVNVFFHGSEDVIAGYVLLYCIPTAVVSCMWCGIYGGNMALSITILVIATCLAPVMTPFSVNLMAKSDISFDVSGMMKSLVMMVVLPSLAGMLINYITHGRCNDHAAPCFKPFTKLALLFVIMINTSQVASRLISEADWIYVPQVLSALLLSASGFVLGWLASRLFSLRHEETVSLVYAVGLKNISAALVLAIDFFPPASAIPVISGIVLQQTVCAIVSRFLFSQKENHS